MTLFPVQGNSAAVLCLVFEQMPKDPKSVSVVVLGSLQLFISLGS